MEQQTSDSHVPSPSVMHPKFEVHRDKKRRYSIPGPKCWQCIISQRLFEREKTFEFDSEPT